MNHINSITKSILLIIWILMIPICSFAQFGAEYSSYGFNFVKDTYNEGLRGWKGTEIGNTTKLNIYQQSATLNDYALEMKAQKQAVQISYDDTGYMDLNPCSFVINLRLNLTQYTGHQDGVSFKLRTGAKLIDLQFQNNGIYYLDNNNNTKLITTAPAENQWFTYTISLDGCNAIGGLMIENDDTNIFPLNIPNDNSTSSIELSTYTNSSNEFKAEIDHLFIYSNPIKWWLGPSVPYNDEDNYEGTTGDRQHFLNLPNGERIGINENAGGYMTYTQLSPTGPNLDPNPKFGSGGTKTLRSYFHSADYNPVQAGTSSTTGGHLVKVNDLTNKLEIEAFPLHLYYKSGITENNVLTFPSGESLTDFDNSTDDNDIYDEFGLDMRHEIITELDFSSAIEDVSVSGGVSTVRHQGEWEFIRHPCQLLQYHEQEADTRFDLNGIPHSDSDMGEMRHKFEFRMNKDLGYEWVLWRENGEWQSMQLTAIGEKKTFSSNNVATIPLENRFMIFSTSNSLTDPNAIAFYYPDSDYNAACTVQKSRVDKSIVSQEDRRYKIQFIADWRKSNWCRMNLYIFNQGLLAPNHGDPNEYESFRMEAHQIFGSPEEIWDQIQGIVLPVELLSFDVVKINQNQVYIQWETASEINNDYFTIERSKDGSNWEAITRINATNTNNEITNYSTTDKSPIKGVSYYRLKQTDLDGTTTYSSIKNMYIDQDPNPVVNIYPNPTSGIVHIQLNRLVVKKMTLLDNLGNNLITKVKQMSNDDEVILNLENLALGFYYLILNGNIVEKIYKK